MGKLELEKVGKEQRLSNTLLLDTKQYLPSTRRLYPMRTCLFNTFATMRLCFSDVLCCLALFAGIILPLAGGTPISSATIGTAADAAARKRSPPSVYPVDEHIFHAVVDHYNFRNPRTFSLRYYVNEQYWNKNLTHDEPPGPVFFYAGNEADIFQFVNNSGFMFEAAEEFGAMVVFAEHRYYGDSIPDAGDLSFLTVEQAMADFNTLTVHMRKQWNMSPETAFVVFGGSYGGNLALWLRLKNPNIWAGAIASSATPLKHLLRETNGFALIETQVYGNVSAECPDLIRRGWKELYEYAKTPSGCFEIAEVLDLCSGCTIRADEIHGWVSEALETLVQYGYPYPTDFYNPVPAYPFAVACRRMLGKETGLAALRAAVDIYYNYTGQAGACFKYDLVVHEATRHWRRKGKYLSRFGPELSTDTVNLDQHADLTFVGSVRRIKEKQHELKFSMQEAWGYQTCTEVYQPMPTDGVTDFEIPYTPNKTAYYEYCWKRYQVHPRPDWEELTFMGSSIHSGSNIYLSSGQLDPWRAAGIQTKPKGSPDSIIVRVIDDGAHHLDLRASHPDDPPSVVRVRKEEKVAIREWTKQWHEKGIHEVHSVNAIN